VRSVDLLFDACAHRIPAGQQLRASVSTCYWPFVFPSAEPVRLSVTVAASTTAAAHLPGGDGSSSSATEPSRLILPLRPTIVRDDSKADGGRGGGPGGASAMDTSESGTSATERVPQFDRPEWAPALAVRELRAGKTTIETVRDDLSDRLSIRMFEDSGANEYPNGVRDDETAKFDYAVRSEGDDPRAHIARSSHR
jgi:hypothetical protein